MKCHEPKYIGSPATVVPALVSTPLLDTPLCTGVQLLIYFIIMF